MTARLALSAITLVLAGLLAAPVQAQTDSTWREHNRAAAAAALRHDYADAKRHLDAMDRLLGGHPAVVAGLARNAARANDTAGAVRNVERLAAMGVTSAMLADSAFNRIRSVQAFQSAAGTVAGNGSTVGSAEIVATLPDSSSIAEDLGYDGARRRFIVSDIRQHRLLAVGLDGRTTPYGAVLAPGWGTLGVAVDARRGVAWVSAVTLPQANGYTAADSGHAAILQLDLASGAVRRRFDLPAPAASAPGDLGLAANGDLFSGDGQTGAVYVIRQGSRTLDTLVPAGRLRGTQQPALAPDNRTLFIPDYARGIARVDRRTGATHWLAYGPDVTLTGIDGLLWDGTGLVATQNGVNPNRVVRLTLNAALDSVTGAAIVLRDQVAAPEPTHAVVVNGFLYLIGNSGWSKYNDDGTAKPDVPREAPRIVRVALMAGTGGGR